MCFLAQTLKSKGRKIAVATFGAVCLFASLYLFSPGPSTVCSPSVRAPYYAIRPSTLFGISFFFESRVLAAFPVGSCETDLEEWLDRKGFEPVQRSDTETGFIDEDEEFARNAERRQSGTKINSRGLAKGALIGRSYFYVAWNADPSGRLAEVYADTELFHFDLP